jgi:YegS/Rv2252/BmrU family lipid kinase
VTAESVEIAPGEGGDASEDGEVGVILNPRAGRGKGIQLLPAVVAALRDEKVPHHIHITAAPREATEIARRFADEGKSRVVAIGGDGIINETINGLIGATRQAALGVVPASRGSDFARSLGTPRDLRSAIARAVKAPPRRIDAGIARFDDETERAFVNIAGVGFDAVVADRANRSRVPGSTLPYLVGIVGTLARFRNLNATIDADGRRSDERVYAVLVANGRYFGGGMKIVPDAAIADGKLDLAILGDLSKPDLLWTLPKVFWGGHVNHPKYRHTPALEVRVESDGEALVELDGEVVGRAPVRFSILPGALLVAG